MAEMPNTETPPLPGGGTGARRRPLAGLCATAIAGWLIGFEFLPPPGFLLAAAAVLLTVSLPRATARWSSFALHLATFVLTMAHASLAAGPTSPSHVARHLTGPRAFVDVLCVIADEPQLRDGAQWAMPARVVAVRGAGSWVHAEGLVEVRWPLVADAPEPAYGQRWRFAGVLMRRTPRGSAPDLQLDVRATAAPAGLGPHSRFYAWCLRQRERASAILGAGLSHESFPRELDLMRALILGERADMEEDVRRAFARTGTLHIVAISGSHVAVFFSLIAAVLRATGRPRPRWVLTAAPVLVVYTFMAGLPPSAVRACIMAIVFLSAPMFRRRGDAATTLAVSALLVLAVSPRDLYDAGFLLSFLVVGGLFIFHGPVFDALARWIPHEPMRPDTGGWRKTVRGWTRESVSLVAATIAAWLVSEPLMAHLFNLNSPVALLANVAVVPLAYLMLLSGCLALVSGVVAGSLLPGLVELFNHAACVFAGAMLRVVDAAAAVPGGYQFVRSPPVGWIVVFYLLLLAVFFSRGRLRLLAALAGAALIAFWSGAHLLSRRAAVAWFHVGGSPVLFLDLPRDRDVLVNTGEDFFAPRVVRMLRQRGVDRLEVLLLTRPSADALGGAGALLDEIPVGEVLMPTTPGRSRVADAFLARCRERKVPVRLVARGDSGDLAGGVRWAALHPSRDAVYRSAADGGLFLRFSRGPAAVAFAGAGGPEFEGDLAACRCDADADVLLAGTKNRIAWSEDVFRLVNPRLTILPEPPGFGAPPLMPFIPAGERIDLPRDVAWRAVLPYDVTASESTGFQWLEDAEALLSNPWKRARGPWWRGGTESLFD